MAITFERYNLTGQPFELGRYDVKRVGREAEWTRLQQIVETARDSRSPINAVLLGTYGAGKTFLLWELARVFKESKKSHVLALGPIRLVDPEQKRDFTRSLVLRLFHKGIDIEETLQPLINKVSESEINAPSAVRPFVTLLLALGRPDSSPLARRVLMGNRLLRKEAEAAGISETPYIRTSDDAIGLLQALQLVVHAAGIQAVILLIDEVEYVDALPKGQRTSVLDSLKHVWDQEVEFFSKGAKAAQLLILLAATPDFWNRTRTAIVSEGGRGESGVGITPFFARIRASDVVEMPAELAQDEARKLIVNRMSELREGSKQGDIIPFTPDYVEYVYRLSQGVPRKIIEVCGVVLEEAAIRKLKKIDVPAAKKILQDLLISYEPSA